NNKVRNVDKMEELCQQLERMSKRLTAITAQSEACSRLQSKTWNFRPTYRRKEETLEKAKKFKKSEKAHHEDPIHYMIIPPEDYYPEKLEGISELERNKGEIIYLPCLIDTPQGIRFNYSWPEPVRREEKQKESKSRRIKVPIRKEKNEDITYPDGTGGTGKENEKKALNWYKNTAEKRKPNNNNKEVEESFPESTDKFKIYENPWKDYSSQAEKDPEMDE
ncbi:15458_t:CDS:2, partial [Cetraspora pellucida]